LIGRALNHTNVSTTQIYARLDLEPVRDAIDKSAALMFGSAADGGGQGYPSTQPPDYEVGGPESGPMERASISRPATLKA
jgi:hypothetical protein